MSNKGGKSVTKPPPRTPVYGLRCMLGANHPPLKIPLMPVVLPVVKSVKPFPVLYEVRTRRFPVFYHFTLIDIF